MDDDVDAEVDGFQQLWAGERRVDHGQPLRIINSVHTAVVSISIRVACAVVVVVVAMTAELRERVDVEHGHEWVARRLGIQQLDQPTSAAHDRHLSFTGGGVGTPGGGARNVETTGREYLFVPAIFSHIFARYSLNFHSPSLCCLHYVQLKRHTQSVLQVEYYETN